MNDSLSAQIIDKIASEKNVDAEDLELQLQRYVPPGVVQDLANHESDAWRLQFETPNHVVEVAGNDTVLVDGQ